MDVKVIYFYHVGKCGGSFVSRNLEQIARELSVSYHSFTYLAGPGKLTSRHNHQLLASFLQLLPNVNQQFLFIHHHHRYPGLKEMLPYLQQCSRKLKQQGDKLYLFTALREPISHWISSVNYWNQTHDISEAKTFSRPLPKNKQAQYLLYNSAGWANPDPTPKKTEIEPILDFMDRVYTTDNLSALEKDLRMWIGRDFKWNATEHNVSEKAIFPDEQQKQRYLEKNGIDLWMYRYAVSRAVGKDQLE